MSNIVFVVINYRMGVLGFLKIDDISLGVPGNAGLKDQILSLKWVQKNIKKFGGDPNRVTVAGFSSGAACVNFLMLSPMGKGLFHRAILHSGSVLNPWAIHNPKSQEVMNFFMESSSSFAEILKKMRDATPEELVDAQNEVITVSV